MFDPAAEFKDRKAHRPRGLVWKRSYRAGCVCAQQQPPARAFVTRHSARGTHPSSFRQEKKTLPRERLVPSQETKTERDEFIPERRTPPRSRSTVRWGLVSSRKAASPGRRLSQRSHASPGETLRPLSPENRAWKPTGTQEWRDSAECLQSAGSAWAGSAQTGRAPAGSAQTGSAWAGARQALAPPGGNPSHSSSLAQCPSALSHLHHRKGLSCGHWHAAADEPLRPRPDGHGRGQDHPCGQALCPSHPPEEDVPPFPRLQGGNACPHGGRCQESRVRNSLTGVSA